MLALWKTLSGTFLLQIFAWCNLSLHFCPHSNVTSAEGFSRFPHLKHITSSLATTVIPSLYPFTPLYCLHSIFHPMYHYMIRVYSHQWMSFIVQELIHWNSGTSSHSLFIPSACEGNSTWEALWWIFSEWKKMNDSGQNGDFNPGLSASKTHVLPMIPCGSWGLVLLILQKEKVILALKQAVYLVLSLSK